MGKMSKKGNKDLFEIVDKLKELLKVDAVHDIYDRMKEMIFSENLRETLKDYAEIIKQDPEIDWIQKMFLFSGADSAGMGQDYTPESLAKIMAEIADYDGAETVLDVCCGTGALTIQLHKKHPGLKFTMLEADSQVITLLLFNLALHNIRVDVIQMDIITQEIYARYHVEPGNEFGTVTQENIDNYKLPELYDIVIANPPFNMKIQPYKSELLKKKCRDGNVLFSEFCISHLKTDGRGGIILMSSAMNKDNDMQNFREFLIKENRLAGCLAMPKNLFDSTTVETCLFCLGQAERPVLVDCKEKKEQNGRKYYFTDAQIKEISGIVHERKETSEKMDGEYFAVIPECDDMEKKNFDYSAVNYMKIDLIPTEEDFKNVISDYLTWKIMSTMKRNMSC